MIDVKALSEIIAVYEKHGWMLRRILERGPDKHRPAGELEKVFKVPMLPSSIDAAWFSRPPAGGPVAWEIRYLGERPFALLESLDENDPNFEESLAEIEGRLQTSVAVK